jgi:hypothetical protein
MCASFKLLGHDVVAEAKCNWYLRDITICSLSKKSRFHWKHSLFFMCAEAKKKKGVHVSKSTKKGTSSLQ